MNKLIKSFHNYNWLLYYVIKFTGIYKILPDAIYLKLLYSCIFYKRLNLTNPQTFSEKIQWLKLYNRKSEFSTMVDKYEIKKHVSKVIGEKYLIPTIGVWDEFDDIDFNKLPKQFVLKCTHDSGSVVICKNKKELDIKLSRNLINKSLKINYYVKGREWPYKNVAPRIIIEEYIISNKGDDLRDYKFFCFNGIAKFIQVDFNRFTNHKRNIYNTEWQLQNFKIEYPNDPNYIIEKPEKFDEMIKLANKLSNNISFLRVDFYFVNDKIYFGEITFFPGGGFEDISPIEWDRKLGDYIKLPLGYD